MPQRSNGKVGEPGDNVRPFPETADDLDSGTLPRGSAPFWR
ncbi:hypothetical protein GCM10029964_024800 [Kibdelosporangium lantanae]